MRVSDILQRAGRQLSDHTHVRWTDAEIIDYINDAQRQIVLLRPDSNSRNESFQLASGSKQTLPARSTYLLRVTRNLGSDGNTPGKVIFPTLRSALDSETPDWHTKTGAAVQHYIYDPNVDKKTFYVYPSADGYIEIVYSTAPDEVSGANDTLDLNDQWINAVLDWVLYRCFSKDSEYSGNAQQAAGYYQRFMEGLQISSVIEQNQNPIRRVRGSEVELR